MQFDHFFVPGFLEPLPIVLLTSREARSNARKAVKYFVAFFFALGPACVGTALAECLQCEGFESMPRSADAFHVLNFSFRLLKLLDCGFFISDCFCSAFLLFAVLVGEAPRPERFLVLGLAQPCERLRDCGRFLTEFSHFPSLLVQL